MELNKDNLGGYTKPTKLLDKDKVVIDSPNSSFTFKFVRSYLLQQRCFANINCDKGVSQGMGGPDLQCADLWPSSHTDQGI